MRLRTLIALIACTFSSGVFATEPAMKEAKDILTDASEQNRVKSAALSFEAFKASVYKEPGKNGKYIVNGDTPITNVKHLKEFFEKNVLKRPVNTTDDPTELIVHQNGGLDAIWTDNEKLHLTYCISNTFAQNYNSVAAAMSAATRAWEAIADVDFNHINGEDGNCTASNPNVVFDVRPVNSGQYLARAFFPNDSRTGRNVLIDGSSFGLDPNKKLTLTGILRHELGHTLGFRHEHTRPDSGTCFEDVSWRPLTSYDDFSVMHYPQCNGLGDWSLRLTNKDKSGAACLYGAAAGFVIDTSVCKPTIIAPTKTKVFEKQIVKKGAEILYGPFQVESGSLFVAKIEGTGNEPGDPDLYTKFDAQANRASFDCRPYLIGAEEECKLDVPDGKQLATIMVRGYDAGSYSLKVIYKPPSQ